MDEHVRISHRDLNARQRVALRRIIRFVTERNGTTRLRYELHRYSNDRFEFTSVVVTGEEGNSPLAKMLCTKRVQASLGKRGGIKLIHAESGFRSMKTHVKYMLGCS